MDPKSQRIYISVDPSKAARCNWCGSTESREWRSTKHGLFCSVECQSAGTAPDYLCAFLVLQVLGVLFAVASFTVSGALSIVLVFELFSLPYLFCFWRGRIWQKRIPMDSRRDDALQDLALLRGIAAVVECPKCNAVLDLSRIGSDKAYRCAYCGATGTVELIKSLH